MRSAPRELSREDGVPVLLIGQAHHILPPAVVGKLHHVRRRAIELRLFSSQQVDLSAIGQHARHHEPTVGTQRLCIERQACNTTTTSFSRFSVCVSSLRLDELPVDRQYVLQNCVNCSVCARVATRGDMAGSIGTEASS